MYPISAVVLLEKYIHLSRSILSYFHSPFPLLRNIPLSNHCFRDVMYDESRDIERYSAREEKELRVGNYCYHEESIVELLLP